MIEPSSRDKANQREPIFFPEARWLQSVLLSRHLSMKTFMIMLVVGYCGCDVDNIGHPGPLFDLCFLLCGRQPFFAIE